MEFVDRILRCSDCGEDFVFTAGEQLFFSDSDFQNDPKRCKTCKVKRSGGHKPGIVRAETRTNCSVCGIETTVPFKPTQGRPMFCRACFKLEKTSVTPAEASRVIAAAASESTQMTALSMTGATLPEMAATPHVDVAQSLVEMSAIASVATRHESADATSAPELSSSESTDASD